MEAWSERPFGSTARQCTDPAQLAGAYIENRGSLDAAIHVLEAVIFGSYLDLPRFRGDIEALTLLIEAKSRQVTEQSLLAAFRACDNFRFVRTSEQLAGYYIGEFGVDKAIESLSHVSPRNTLRYEQFQLIIKLLQGVQLSRGG